MKELEVEISGELEPRSTTSSFFISGADKRAPALDFIAVDLTCKYIFIHSHVVRSFVDGGEMLWGEKWQSKRRLSARGAISIAQELKESLLLSLYFLFFSLRFFFVLSLFYEISFHFYGLPSSEIGFSPHTPCRRLFRWRVFPPTCHRAPIPLSLHRSASAHNEAKFV